MKVIMYGSHLCQDTIYAITKLKDAGVTIKFMDISSNFDATKAFMKIRETTPLLDRAKAEDKIGIPLFVLEDGSMTLDWRDVVKMNG